METKDCSRCHLPKPIADYEVRRKGKVKIRTYCRDCYNKYAREYVQNRPDQQERQRNYGMVHRLAVKQQVFEYYGSKCACCGETEFIFLTLDHVNNDGAEHRRQLAGPNGEGRNVSPDKIFRILVRTNFEDADRFQVLCYNCNCGRRSNHGVCPHKECH